MKCSKWPPPLWWYFKEKFVIFSKKLLCKVPNFFIHNLDVIGRQPWISVYSNTGRGIDIILSLNIQQECIHCLIVVQKTTYFIILRIALKCHMIYIDKSQLRIV
jgi:hypothetical protein